MTKFVAMMKFINEMKLRTLRWGDYPGLSTGPNLIIQDLKSEKSSPAVVRGSHDYGWRSREEPSEKEPDLALLALKTGGAMSQGVQVASRR